MFKIDYSRTLDDMNRIDSALEKAVAKNEVRSSFYYPLGAFTMQPRYALYLQDYRKFKKSARMAYILSTHAHDPEMIYVWQQSNIPSVIAKLLKKFVKKKLNQQIKTGHPYFSETELEMLRADEGKKRRMINVAQYGKIVSTLWPLMKYPDWKGLHDEN